MGHTSWKYCSTTSWQSNSTGHRSSSSYSNSSEQKIWTICFKQQSSSAAQTTTVNSSGRSIPMQQMLHLHNQTKMYLVPARGFPFLLRQCSCVAWSKHISKWKGGRQWSKWLSRGFKSRSYGIMTRQQPTESWCECCCHPGSMKCAWKKIAFSVVKEQEDGKIGGIEKTLERSSRLEMTRSTDLQHLIMSFNCVDIMH